MNLRRSFKRLLPLPISSYLIVFFSLATLLYALIGGWMLHQSSEITRLANEGREQAASQELAQALQRVDSEVVSIANRLGTWEEIYQQLGDATFYEYWRSNRALLAGYTPDYVVALELYDKDGTILQPSPAGAMPDDGLSHTTIRIEQGRPYIYNFSRVSRMGDAPSVIGHIGIKVDFHKALLNLNRFIYVNTDTIHYPPVSQPMTSLNKLLEHTRFQALPIVETEQLVILMHDTLQHSAIISLLLLTLAYFSTNFLLHAPLRNLSAYIDTLRRGHADGRVMPTGHSFCVREFEVLRNSVVSYQLELEQMHSSLDQKNRELWKLAHHDALTGIANRRAYEEDWQKLQQLIRGQRIELSVLLIDCDHFKAINDSYGHDVGDRVLKAVADILARALREGDQLYRLGGDEFAVHLLNADINQAAQLATRCLQRLEHHDFKQLGIREPVRFSIGLASANGDDQSTIGKLHKHADIAMYQAKRPGSCKIVHYSPAMAVAADSITSNRFISAIYRAIESGEGFELHYQPVISLQREYQGFHEVLLRLRDKEGLIMPLNIFPIINAEGLAVELDFAIIRHLATRLQAEGEAPGRISLNIDGDTLMHHDFMTQIAALKPYLQRHPHGIVLEITETALISELQEAGRRLQQLRQLGYTIALDDFGSGYSSLRYLASMPVDIIKFDINLIRDLEGDTPQAEITADMARMIRRTGYQLVAEGIESEGLLEKVQALGFSHVQGFLFGRPASKPINLGSAQQALLHAG